MGKGQLMAASPRKKLASAPEVTPEPKMIDVVLHTLDDAKADDTVSVDIAGKSSLADNMVVTSGRSNRHVSAIADQLVKSLRESGFSNPRNEGMPQDD